MPLGSGVISPMDLLDSSLFAVVGDEGFTRLVAAFYRRIPTDEILGPMYQGRNLADAQWRLREFLIGRFGGPMRYVEKRGHPRLRMRHAPFVINQAARDRWITLMSAAMDETRLAANANAVLRSYFEQTATFMMNQQ
jgi:hemoglobin